MEIPINNALDKKEELIKKIVTHLHSNDSYISYRASNGVALSLAHEVCRAFVDKGYHAKINYFCDGRASYQMFTISKHYCDGSNGRMIYSEIIG